MKIIKLKNINKLFFSYEDIASIFKISEASAMVTASRYVEAGLILRQKRNLYILKEKWDMLDHNNLFCLANILQVPSYISLMTALSYYEITTQIQQNYIESFATKRTKEFSIENTVFTYSKIKSQLYNGFIREQNIFSALPEKAFLDALYLNIIGRYNFDLTSVDLSKFDRKFMNILAKSYPDKIQNMVRKDEYTGTA